ncbi:MAG TPA: hypothetical protein VIS94_07800 [Desulfomonilia bacterium]
MKLTRVAIIVFLITFYFNCVSAGERPTRFEKPEETVAWLYRDFGWECFIQGYFEKDILINQPRIVLERYFTPKLANLIFQDRAYGNKTGEIGHIDFVLLFGSQDPDGIYDLRIKRIPKTDSVLVVYDQNGEHDIVEIKYYTVQTNKGWRISDIRYRFKKTSAGPENRFSLLELLS